ncbi:SDR family oxidoreductase [Sphingomonas qomolangmaensis]|uniref:SDR family NAD(P)-dependent oxidoreductase n=1 Tax=Sphingomonas qomolangmaensis TaxID=2918765 RepID=A0ABY5LAH0_9SPHN|nr:SDR family NAD(P)-dependent oxidoreductase [Sphingomonas qomolangmaensis]UUL82862.1 SDR family NAD(P)-dependent oxidoreductase [Sphingomonas qomolangmaensis]
MSKECVLVTGGGSGIGMGLAEAFHARGATVMIAGRNRASLDAVALRCPGMMVADVDVSQPASVEALVACVADRLPGLNLLINNAGIQQVLDFAGETPPDIATISREIDTNLKGLIHVSAAFLPLLRRQPSARLVHIGSGLAYVPLAMAPVYSATKAAVHSFTMSLRYQLADTSVKVVEILPPVVDTALHRGLARTPPKAMPLPAFVAAAMKGLDAGDPEVVVGLAKVLKLAQRVAPRLFFGVVNKNSV